MNVMVLAIVFVTGILSLATGYLYFLALLGFMFQQGRAKPSRVYRFLILVPAHNESRGLCPTIGSLKDLSNDHEQRIVVIVDNCTDDTADVARKSGADVLERTNPELRGKGYALQWALEQFNLDDFDAVVVVNADTTVEKNMLDVMAGALDRGTAALQVNYLFMPSGDSAIGQLQHIASLVENQLFYKGRALLGLPVLLRGSGMAIRTEILKEHPWDSHSITEDVDFSVKLSRLGHRVEFTTATSVYSAATTEYNQAVTQKTRWASGTFALIADHFFPLLAAGLKGRPGLIEMAFSLFLLSRPLLIYVAAVVMLLSLLIPSPERWLLVSVNLLIIFLLIVYLLLGALLADDRYKAARAISRIPGYGLWFLGIQVKSLMGFRKSDWERTARNTDGEKGHKKNTLRRARLIQKRK
jgi:cellulose synthase/poly-beta-1,6-N-acetylglucosamine synthase-like glycosyltransferase